MTKIHNITSSKVKLDKISDYNPQTQIYAIRKGLVGKSFTIPFFHKPEAKQTKEPWVYSINKYGYRGADWTFENSPAFFGCSCTFGIGVEVPVSERVAKRMGIKNIPNMGIPGGSVVNIIKTFAAFSRLHPVSDAVIILPPISRVFLPKYDEETSLWSHISHIPGFITNNKKHHKQVMTVFTDDVNLSYTVDYIDWAEQIAKNRNIRIHWGSWDVDTTDILKKLNCNPFHWATIDRARDAAHPGATSHSQLATQLTDQLVNTKET